ncbi:alpha/beta hydrolase [Turneriella parva]|uniref:MhpC-like protein n=1 Tax=Turneriella parva (strain ATCC BAA-1111 / DSM 21527 / NCTC 11395 / H) TaxID=869212 RepID=I4B7N9_TURPD|nr:alpha/beta hydrolase [Turneriella parva]AFM13296.1 MhpC-like protein [Turneriella parva DSM 21527]
MRKLIVTVTLAAGALFYGRAYCKRADLQYSYKPQVTAKTFEDFAERNRNFSRAIGVADYNAEKLTIHNPENNGLAFLYLHGFGATRGEGEMVVEELAESLRANAYYVRLPGHGLNADAHAAATFDQYLNTCEEALLHMPLLGKKTVIIASSTGSLIATYLAHKHPKLIHAAVLTAPLWDFGNKTTRLLNFPGGLELGQLALGKERDARWKEDPEKRQHGDYYKHWLAKQKFSAVVNLNNLRRYIVEPDRIKNLEPAIMVMVYFKDEKHYDDTIDIKVIREWLQVPGKSQKNKLVEIADGNHILLSEFVRTDKKTIIHEISTWLEAMK